MKQSLLLVLLALALPTAAIADSVDLTVNGGTLTVGSTSASLTTNVTSFSLCNPNCGVTNSITGSAAIVFPSFSTSSNGSFSGGGSMSLTAGSYAFNGAFTSGTWMVTTVGTGKNKQFEYQFTGIATGALTSNGNTVPTTLTFVIGETTLAKPVCVAGSCKLPFASGNVAVGTVPEPGTLSLLGTGLVGIAGAIRRKFAAGKPA